MADLSTLLLADLHQSMDESFIKKAFQAAECPIVSCEMIRDKIKNCSVALVKFVDDIQAKRAVDLLNGRPIPGWSGAKSFHIVSLSAKADKRAIQTSHQLFLSNLRSGVSQVDLLNALAPQFPGCIGVHVCANQQGTSKGYAVAYFSSEGELRKASDQIHSMTEFSDGQFQTSRIDDFTEKRAVPVPNVQDSRLYSSHISPAILQYPDDELYRQLEEQDQNVMDYLKNSSVSNFQSGWAHCFDPRDEDNTEVGMSVERLNDVYFNEGEELYAAVEASRWYPIDNVLAKVDTTKK